MNTYFRNALTLVIALSITAGLASTAQAADGALSLPVTGTFKGGGDFAGRITVNRFAVHENGRDIVAIGFVSGVLTKGNKPVGTVVHGQVSWPVTLRSSAAFASNARIGAVTPSQDCPVLQISLGPLDVNLLGFSVTLGAISLDIVGEEGTPLGDLVCQISALLGQVAAVVELVVGLLNTLLGLLNGLLGGLIPA